MVRTSRYVTFVNVKMHFYICALKEKNARYDTVLSLREGRETMRVKIVVRVVRENFQLVLYGKKEFALRNVYL